MILVDTSVWVDFLKGASSPHRRTLHRLIAGEEDISITDIILTEILQGIKNDMKFKSAKDYLLEFPIYGPKDTGTYIRAAQLNCTGIAENKEKPSGKPSIVLSPQSVLKMIWRFFTKTRILISLRSVPLSRFIRFRDHRKNEYLAVEWTILHHSSSRTIPRHLSSRLSRHSSKSDGGSCPIAAGGRRDELFSSARDCRVTLVSLDAPRNDSKIII